MDEAEPFLMKLLNFTIKPDYKPPRKLKNNKYRNRYRNISKHQIRRLQEVYKYDLELFKYPKSPFDWFDIEHVMLVFNNKYISVLEFTLCTQTMWNKLYILYTLCLFENETNPYDGRQYDMTSTLSVYTNCITSLCYLMNKCLKRFKCCKLEEGSSTYL